MSAAVTKAFRFDVGHGLSRTRMAHVIRDLKAEGINAHLQHYGQEPALSYVVRKDLLGIALALIDAGADPRLPSGNGSYVLTEFMVGWTREKEDPPRGLSRINDLERRFAMKLMDCGVDLEQADTRGNTPLLRACMDASPRIELALEMGCNAHAVDINGRNGIDLLVQRAVRSGFMEGHWETHVTWMMDAGCVVQESLIDRLMSPSGSNPFPERAAAAASWLRAVTARRRLEHQVAAYASTKGSGCENISENAVASES